MIDGGILLLLGAVTMAGYLGGLVTAWITNGLVRLRLQQKHEKEMLQLRHKLDQEQFLLGAPVNFTEKEL